MYIYSANMSTRIEFGSVPDDVSSSFPAAVSAEVKTMPIAGWFAGDIDIKEAGNVDGETEVFALLRGIGTPG